MRSFHIIRYCVQLKNGSDLSHFTLNDELKFNKKKLIPQFGPYVASFSEYIKYFVI